MPTNPNTKPCPECLGNGEVISGFYDGNEVCYGCHGTGQVPVETNANKTPNPLDRLEDATRSTIAYLYLIGDDCPPEIARGIGTLRQVINEEYVGDKTISSRVIWDILKPYLVSIDGEKDTKNPAPKNEVSGSHISTTEVATDHYTPDTAEEDTPWPADNHQHDEICKAVMEVRNTTVDAGTEIIRTLITKSQIALLEEIEIQHEPLLCDCHIMNRKVPQMIKELKERL